MKATSLNVASLQQAWRREASSFGFGAPALYRDTKKILDQSEAATRKRENKKQCPHGRRKDNCNELECGGCVHRKKMTRCPICKESLPPEMLVNRGGRKTVNKMQRTEGGSSPGATNQIESSPSQEKQKQKQKQQQQLREPTVPAVLSCIFCNSNEKDNIGTEYTPHTYVTVNFAGVAIYLCIPCKENWRIFRQSATDKSFLILEGETNEEICAVCSDTPEDDLILCSSCPRSYCSQCIKRALRPSDIDDMNSTDDWICMVCSFEGGIIPDTEKEESTPSPPVAIGSSNALLDVEFDSDFEKGEYSDDEDGDEDDDKDCAPFATAKAAIIPKVTVLHEIDEDAVDAKPQAKQGGGKKRKK